MEVLKFDITVDELDDVRLLIETKIDHTFKDLHDAITDALKLRSERGASFYVSNNKGQKLNEITLGRESKFENAVNGLKTKIAKVLEEYNKFIYINDNVPQFTFYLSAETSIVKGTIKNLPRVTKAEGKLPSASSQKKFTDNLFKDDYDLGTGEVYDETEDNFLQKDE